MAGQMFVAFFHDKFYGSHLHLPGVISGVGEYHNYPVMSGIYVNKTGFYATISGFKLD